MIGAAGSGKTSILREWMLTASARNARLVIYDPMDRLDGLMVTTYGEAARAASRRASRTRMQDPDLFVRMMTLACRAGDCLLVIDEAQDVFPRHSDPERLRVVQRGRNLGVGMLWASQRPTRCDTDLAGNSQGMIIGTLLGPADMAIARSWGVTTPLPKHRFRVILPDWQGEIASKAIVRGPSPF